MNSRIKYRIRGTVKKMNFVSSIYWKFFYCPAALQMKLSELPDVSELTDYHIVSLSKYSPLFDDYVQFINISYEEKVYSKESLSVLLENHHYLKDIQTYLLLDNNGCIVALVIMGIVGIIGAFANGGEGFFVGLFWGAIIGGFVYKIMSD